MCGGWGIFPWGFLFSYEKFMQQQQQQVEELT